MLTGIPHIPRIRVLANPENRILYVMQTLKLSREKAKQYIEEVDSGRDKWVRFLCNVDWHDLSHYDLLVHPDQLCIANAASALYPLADLPDFKLTPASDGCGRHFDQHCQGLFKTLIERLQGDSLNRQSDLV